MEEVGVQAVVKGLQSFLSDTGRVNSAIDGLRPSGSLLQNMFSSLAETVGNFGREILNVAEVTLGVMLRDAIEFVLGQLRQLIDSVIEAGSEFQILELRLQRINFNTLVESGMEFNDAMQKSIDLTKAQLDWIQKLAAQTPYDAQDIANTFTLARAYGFSADEAKRLTENILDFASGMGLSNEEMMRIIINFGQLMQQGKLNAQDLKDLARGAFVPINDILARMAKNLGISVEELNKMRKAGEGGAAMVTGFMEAFNQLVEERFTGAAEKMARTFLGAKQNVIDLFKSILGLGVVKPILDVIGERLASFVSAFTDSPKMWEELTRVAKEFGLALAEIIGAIIDVFIPSSTEMANTVLKGFEGLTVWVRQNKLNIIRFFIDLREKIGDVVGWIRDHLLPIFERILTWVNNNKGTILEFFATLAGMVGEFLSDLFGGRGKATGGDFLDKLLAGIKDFMQFVIDNHDKILKFVEVLWSLFFIAEILITVWNIFVGVLGAVGGIIVGAIGFVLSLISVFSILSLIVAIVTDPIALITVGIMLLGLMIGLLMIRLALWWENNKKAIADWAAETKKKIDTWVTETWTKFADWCAETKKKIDTWVTDTWARFADWAAEAKKKIDTWATDTWGSFTNWVTNVLGTIGGWKDTFLNTIALWVTQFILDVDQASNGAVGKFAFYTTETLRLLTEWVANQGTKLSEWVADTNAKTTQAATDSKTAYADWLNTTYAGLVQWVADTNAKHIEAQENAKTATNDWTTATLASISQWVIDTGAKLDEWRSTEKTKSDEWWAAFTEPITTWAENAKKAIEEWLADTKEKFDTWKDDLVKKFRSIGTDITRGLYNGLVDGFALIFTLLAEKAQGMYETVRDILGAQSPSTLFYGLGESIVQGIISGITDWGQSLQDALVRLVLDAVQAALEILGIASPSKVFFDIGENMVLGMAEGIKKTANAAAEAVGDAMKTVMSPAMGMPSLVTTFSMVGAGGGNSNSEVNNNYNLSINSNAAREPIIQDFGMLKSLQGG